MLKPSSYTNETDIKYLEDYIFNYLEKNMNKGNILAISGKWGGGKTYFWKHGIKDKLDKNGYEHLYISLYGIDSIEKIEDIIAEKIIINNERKQAIYDKIKVPVQIGQDTLKKLFGVDSEKYINIAAKSNVKKTLQDRQIILCFDDLERKSSLLSINDFFGLIANLRDEYNLLITIIYNEMHIQDQEQNIYASTKEKLIDKYIVFNPNAGSLFSIILRKYSNFENYNYIKHDIEKEITKNILEPLNFINARTYDKFLMNIFEWLNKYPNLNSWTFIKYIILSTICFVHTNITLNFRKNKTVISNDETGVTHINILFTELEKSFIDEHIAIIHNTCINSRKSNDTKETFLNIVIEKISTNSDIKQINFSNHDKNILQAIYLYGYCFDYGNEIDTINNEKINNFIQTGILV